MKLWPWPISLERRRRLTAVHGDPRDGAFQLFQRVGFGIPRYEIGANGIGGPILPADLAVDGRAHRHVAGEDQNLRREPMPVCFGAAATATSWGAPDIFFAM